jgi:aldose 1-epimerase
MPPTPRTTTLTLASGSLGLQIAPGAGGALARFWREAEGGGPPLELLRPASAEALARGDPFAMASFPLVPYSNRIRDGRFTFAGRAVSQARNRPPDRHPLHGHGWQAAWRPTDVTADTAVLEYHHPADAWPWPYRAVQRLALTPRHLTVELALTNEADTPMPAGLGHHPYVPRTPRTTLTAAVERIWLTDVEIMPTALVAPEPGRDPRVGLAVDTQALDNCFTGWGGRAVVTWPERHAELTIAAGPPFGCLVVYTPPGRDFFCVEPVSHVTDAFNLAAAGRADTGMQVLAPGETLRTTVTFTP